MIHLTDDGVRTVPLEQIDFMKRYACKYCSDYASEYADISFGGIGAEEGWTTVITRTPLGRAIFADAKSKTLEGFDFRANSDLPARVLDKIRAASSKKKAHARQMHDALVKGQ